MVFVAVGTQKFQFNRLLKAVDDLIEQGQLDEEVFAQVGHSDYVPRYYACQNFLSREEFQACIERCDLLITHSGVATIIAGLKLRKPTVVVPRLAKFGEHVDDHQFQIGENFSSKDMLLMCREEDDLGELVKEARSRTFVEYESQRDTVIQTVREYLNSI